jgi:hypothetical protein
MPDAAWLQNRLLSLLAYGCAVGSSTLPMWTFRLLGDS